MSTYGSYDWAQPTGGRMSGAERRREVLRGLRAVARARAGQLGAKLGLKPRAIQLALAEIPVPRSPLAEAAEQALQGEPAWEVGHGWRTYLFGSLLGIRDGVTVEPELLFAAALLHDLGLVHREGAPCFALRGGEQARALLVAKGIAPVQADRVREAITLHLCVRVDVPAPEARLLRAGAGLDVAGERLHHVAPATRAEVLRAWPRAGFLEAVSAALSEEARAHPETRAGFLCHGLGFLRLAAQADRRFQR